MASPNWKAGLAEAGGTLQLLGVGYTKSRWEQENKIDLLNLQSELLKARDIALADVERETYRLRKATDLDAAGKAADIEVDTARRKPRSLAPGHSEVVDGQIRITAPDVSRPQELLDFYRAQADRLNAETNAIEKGMKYGSKKVLLPSIRVEKDAEGNVYNIDTGSGAIGRLIAAQPAKKGESRWFKPDDPDTPAQPARIEWSLGGRILPDGLASLYPALRDRAGGATRPGIVDPFRSGGQPTEADIQGLYERRRVPEAIEFFDRRFGPGSAAKYLNQAEGGEGSGEGVGDERAISVPSLQVNTPRQLSMREQHLAARDKATVAQQERRAKFIKDGFNVMLQTGRFWPEDQPAIEEALKAGVLTDQEQSIARKMLSEIEGNTEFGSGFKKGRGVPAGFAR